MFGLKEHIEKGMMRSMETRRDEDKTNHWKSEEFMPMMFDINTK